MPLTQKIGPLFSDESNNNDAAKDARRLFDTIAVCENISAALSEFVDKYAQRLPKCAVRDIRLLSEGARCVHWVGMKQAANVSVLNGLLEAYHQVRKLRAEEEREKETELSQRSRVSASMRHVKKFVAGCTVAPTKRPSSSDNDLVEAPKCTPPKKKLRRSERRPVTPDPIVKYTIDSFTGKPIDGAKEWTKIAIIRLIADLKNHNVKPNAFLKKIIASKSCPFYQSDVGPMYRLYREWEQSKTIRGRVGRPQTMSVAEALDCVKEGLSSSSLEGGSQFKLAHMQSIFEQKRRSQAQKIGLDPDSVNCSVSARTAKTMMTAVAMLEDSSLHFNKHKSINKTEARYRAEHSVMGAQAFAMTDVTTGIKAGAPPPWMSEKRFRGKKPSKQTLETIEWMKDLLGAEQVYPVLQDLLLSTDDTTVFAFEGCKDTGDWEWKLVDKSLGDTSVRSDFTVGDDAENSGGLRVRLTFTFSATGQSAPMLISVSGLTTEELSPEKCPDGILAAKLLGVGKGGSVLGSNVFSWIYFLRADGKGSKNEREEATLRIANKKFMTYNDDILLPFIRQVRTLFGWKPGQPIPDWLEAISWSDGDIAQLQTLVFDARQALDDVERIVRNKHTAGATGTQQPCDLSPVFKLIKDCQKRMTGKNTMSKQLIDVVYNLFDGELKQRGLSLDGNPRKKKALIDFLLCLNDILDKCLNERNIRKGFIESGLTDEETGMWCSYERLMRTCKRWPAATKKKGIPLSVKEHVRSQFRHLGMIQLNNGCVTYKEMIEAGFPLGTLNEH